MKRISKLNLVNLYKDEMEKREMSSIEGACEDCCGCGCLKYNSYYNMTINDMYAYSKSEWNPDYCACVCWGGDSDAQQFYQQTGTWPW